MLVFIFHSFLFTLYSKTCVKRPLSKRLKNGFQDQLSLNAGQKYCRMLQREHLQYFLTFIKLPAVIKIFVLSIFELSFYTGFTVALFGPRFLHGLARQDSMNHVVHKQQKQILSRDLFFFFFFFYLYFKKLCSQQFFVHIGMSLVGLNMYKATDEMSCSRT